LFKNGFYSVQDLSAGLTIENLFKLYQKQDNASSNPDVLDMCAAPGGKALYIQELFKNQANIYLNDIDDNKEIKIRENFQRLKLNFEDLTFGDALNYPDDKMFDLIILDVPCSGLGVIAKKPGIKYNQNLENIRNLIDLQYRLLEKGASLLKVGGILQYSTCTINPEENEKNIEKFLAKFNNFSILSYSTFDEFIYKEKYFASFPFKNKCDGAFGAFLRRIK